MPLLPATAPVAFGRATAQTQRPGPLWGLLRPPLPTNAWWQNLVLGAGDQPVAPYPYLAAAMGHVGPPHRVVLTLLPDRDDVIDA